MSERGEFSHEEEAVLTPAETLSTLREYYSSEELEVLAFKLGVPGVKKITTRWGRAQHIVDALVETNKFQVLLDALASERPFLDLPSSGNDYWQTGDLEKQVFVVLNEAFSESELRTLVFDLEFDIENFGGETKTVQVVRTIQRFVEEKMFSELVAYIDAQRPGTITQSESSTTVEAAPEVIELTIFTREDEKNLIDFLQTTSLFELRKICFFAGTNYENLSGETLTSKKYALASLLVRDFSRISGVFWALSQLMPEADFSQFSSVQTEEGKPINVHSTPEKEAALKLYEVMKNMITTSTQLDELCWNLLQTLSENIAGNTLTEKCFGLLEKIDTKRVSIESITLALNELMVKKPAKDVEELESIDDFIWFLREHVTTEADFSQLCTGLNFSPSQIKGENLWEKIFVFVHTCKRYGYLNRNFNLSLPTLLAESFPK